ncbi:ChbG/HpnK family deacetylase [Patescibacteria group bacterium]|nr:ChbG/HpnK family deacetylase [Patescibacteria group bacterium]MBU1256091.1 ChbG/HpnK family deacetylase [Patescibacteria group bacterium]MBU1457694.1 ChbG/HpnK family deacetylase [Patescibacteria group bacterium]
MKKFIFNADDLGSSEKVNQGIFRCADAGIVKSTSLMITNPLAKETYKQAIDHKISVGLHLNVTGEGKFLTNTALFGKTGKINHAFKINLLLENKEVEIVLDEFQKQLNLFIKHFRKSPDHINFHHPLYQIPNFTKPFADFVKKTSLPTRWFNDLSGYGCKTPNHTEFGFFDQDSLTLGNIIKLIDGSRSGVIEFVLHPGLYNPDSTSSYNHERGLQTEVLTNPELLAHIGNADYQIISFNEL